jgi:hypothetical protein
VADGDVVSFGVNLGGLPSLTFNANNLVALQSGQTYQLYAENLTSTGFTARLKVSTPSAPANFNLTAATQPGSGPQFQMDKGSSPDSSDGNYRLLAYGNVTIRSQLRNDYQ